MQIKQSLPQFNNESALIIVAGKQSAECYLAQNGNITELKSFAAEVPGYTDKPGHFESQSRGKTWQSGTAYDPSDTSQDAKQHFLRQFPDYVDAIAEEHPADRTYLFAPDYMISEVKAALPKRVQKSLACAIQGNYTKHHPLKLIERISKEEDGDAASAETVPPHKIEAKKILQRFFRRK